MVLQRSEQPDRYRFAVPANNEASHRVLAQARRLFDFDDDDDDLATGVLVALSEVVQNAANALNVAGVDRDIEIIFDADPPTGRVVDFADGFGWGAVRGTVPDPTSTTGRGLLLASTFVQGLSIDSGPGGTTVTIPLQGSTPSASIDPT